MHGEDEDDGAAAVLAGAHSGGDGEREQLQRYAKRHGLSLAGLYNAKSVLKRAGLLKSASSEFATNAFLPVQLAPQAQPPIRCRLQHVSGLQLEMGRLPDAKWLRDLIRSDRDASA